MIEPSLPFQLPDDMVCPPDGAAVSADEGINTGDLSRFDYHVMAAEVAVEMRDAADRIRAHHRNAVIEVGRELLAVKARIEHGHSEEWVERECHMPIRGAQRAMLAAEMVGKNDKLSYLPQDGLLALAARSAPVPIVTEIMGRIDAGERPDAAEIKRQIETAKREAEDAKLPSRQRHARARQREDEERRRQELGRRHAAHQARQTKAAEAAAALLLGTVGDRLAELTRLLEASDWWRVCGALRKAGHGDAGNSAMPAASVLTTSSSGNASTATGLDPKADCAAEEGIEALTAPARGSGLARFRAAAP